MLPDSQVRQSPTPLKDCTWMRVCKVTPGNQQILLSNFEKNIDANIRITA